MFFKKYCCVLQQDEKDCGPACIMTILEQFGMKYSLAKLREKIGTDIQGTSIYGMIKGLTFFCIKCEAIKVETKKLPEDITVPIIIHTINKDNLNHYVVLQKIGKKYMTVSDPAYGIVKIEKDKFYKMWTGYAILIYENNNIKIREFSKTNFISFLKIFKNYKTLIKNIILISFFIIGLNFLLSLYFKILVDYIIKNKLKKTFNIVTICFISLTILKAFFEYFRNQINLILSQKIDDLISFGYFKKLMELPVSFYLKRKTGEIISRFKDGIKVREILLEVIFNFSIDILISFFGAFILFNINKKMFLVALFILLLNCLIIFSTKKIIKNKSKELLENNSIWTSSVIENVNAIKLIKSYNLEEKVKSDVETKYLNYLKSDFEKSFLYNRINLILTIVSILGNYLIIWIGTNKVINGEFTIGNLLVFITIFSYFIDPLKRIISLQNRIQEGIVASERIGEILDLEIEEKQDSKIEKKLESNIIIENLNFRYGTRNLILKNINMVIKKNQKVAFVGKSGSGKTTLINLLLRYFDFESGNIFFDDVKIEHINLSYLRNYISYVSQDTFLFNKSLKENLLLNDEGKDIEIEKMFEMLDLKSFIENLPDKLETVIEENGSNLSGGQKQKISIIRAILKNPDILIFDEATSALDKKSEKLVKKMIDNYKKTTIIVSHKLEMVKDCDYIYLFEDGEIIEEGCHDDLIKAKGKYYKFWEE